MAANITLFAQAIATLPKKTIKSIINKCNSDMLLPHYVLITDGKKGDNTAAK